MTQTTNNWPDPKQEYVPLFPDRDGAHAIEVAGLEITDIVYYWHQNGGGWTEYNHQGSEDFLTDDDMQGWIYKGPSSPPRRLTKCWRRNGSGVPLSAKIKNRLRITPVGLSV